MGQFNKYYQARWVSALKNVCRFSREEFLILADSEKQAAKKSRLQRKHILSAFVVAAKRQKSLFKISLCRFCSYSLETRRKLALKSLWRFLPFYTPSAVKDNRAISSIKGLLELCAVQLLWGEEWGTASVILCCCNKTPSYCGRYRINKLKSPMTGALVTQPLKEKNTHTCTDWITYPNLALVRF